MGNSRRGLSAFLPGITTRQKGCPAPLDGMDQLNKGASVKPNVSSHAKDGDVSAETKSEQKKAGSCMEDFALHEKLRHLCS